MTDASATSIPTTPRHLWIVGVLALLWNAMGAVDYLMTQTRNPSYLQGFTADQLAYFNGFPRWVIATWATGVWGGVAGALLLLLRRRLAVPVLLVSLCSAALTFLYNVVLSDGLRIMGGSSALLMPGVVLLGGALLLLYARRMARNNTLRP
jgi:hypothetical protein